MVELLGAMPGAVAQGLIWGVMAVGVYITFRILDIADLTVDGTICTGAAVCTMLMMSDCNPYLAILLALLAGILAGTLTGLLHILLGIPAILAGILSQMVLWSANLKILGKANQALSARDNPVLLSQMNIPSAIIVLAIVVVAVIALLYLFFGTEIGCAIRATGCNQIMSRAQGINTSLMKIIGLAAVVIGEAVVSKISTNFAVRLTGVVIGAVIYYIVYQTIIFAGFDTDMLKMFSAIVVAAFLGIPYIKKKISASAKPAKGGANNA